MDFLFASILGVLVMLLCFYFYHYAIVLSTSEGQQIDNLYLRLWILGILTSSLGVFLIAFPLIAFMLGKSWLIVGTIMVTSLFVILACMLTIRDVERAAANMEGLRSKGEHYCYLNRVQMIELKQWIWLICGFIIVFAVSLLRVHSLLANDGMKDIALLSSVLYILWGVGLVGCVAVLRTHLLNSVEAIADFELEIRAKLQPKQ